MLRLVFVSTLLATNFIAGCAINSAASGQIAPQTGISSPAEAARYAGRISLVIEVANSDAPAQSFAGRFELRGQPQAAELDIISPLGQTVAQLSWSAEKAELKTGAQTQRYPSAQAMMSTLLGIDMPPQLLFDWLSGLRSEAPAALDWQVDLSAHADGRIVARRSQPSPALLRIILDKP